MRLLGILTALLIALPLGASKFDHNYTELSSLLSTAVSYNPAKTKSKVDYDKVDLEQLNTAINKMLVAKRDEVLKTFTYSQRLSYFINLYNAVTLRLIKTNYKKLKNDGSIKDLRKGFPTFTSPWDQDLFKLFGKDTTLNQIEHGYIRGYKSDFSEFAKDYKDPRIHFAVNCASIGCPALANQAYTANNLEKTLEESMVHFLKDRDRNYVDEKNKKVYVSKIFDWYEEDFEKGLMGWKSLKDFIESNIDHLTDNEAQKKVISNGNYSVKFTSYNWNLNNKF